MAIKLKSTHDIVCDISARAKSCRLELNLSQATLSKMSGVSLGTLKKFESTGKISIESLVKISIALKAHEEFDELFNNSSADTVLSLDRLIHKKSRLRGTS